MAQQFAITSLDEAKAYLQHSLLGLRLRESTQLVLSVEGYSGEDIFSYLARLKFRSCMTLFLTTATNNALFNGKPDQLTLDLLAQYQT